MVSCFPHGHAGGGAGDRGRHLLALGDRSVGGSGAAARRVLEGSGPVRGSVKEPAYRKPRYGSACTRHSCAASGELPRRLRRLGSGRRPGPPRPARTPRRTAPRPGRRPPQPPPQPRRLAPRGPRPFPGGGTGQVTRGCGVRRGRRRAGCRGGGQCVRGCRRRGCRRRGSRPAGAGPDRWCSRGRRRTAPSRCRRPRWRRARRSAARGRRRGCGRRGGDVDGVFDDAGVPGPGRPGGGRPAGLRRTPAGRWSRRWRCLVDARLVDRPHENEMVSEGF